MRDLDLRPAEAFPRAVTQLDQPRIVAPVARVEPQFTADDLRGLAHAAERAAQEDRGAGDTGEFGVERAAHGPGLGAATIGEVGVPRALHAPFGVPLRLAMPQQVERSDESGRPGHDVRRRITIFAAP